MSVVYQQWYYILYIIRYWRRKWWKRTVEWWTVWRCGGSRTCTSAAVRSSPCQSTFGGCESLRDSVGAWVQPGEKLNLWLLLAHHPLLHKMSVLYSIVWFQVGVQHPSFTEGGVSVLSFITRIDDDIHTDVRVYFVDVSSPYSYFQQIGVLSSRVWLLCILVQACLLLLHRRWLGYPFFFKLALTISYLNINVSLH